MHKRKTALLGIVVCLAVYSFAVKTINHMPADRKPVGTDSARLQKLSWIGELTRVERNSVTMRVFRGDEQGRTVQFFTNESTSVQIAGHYISGGDRWVDLTGYFQPGDKTDLLVMDGHIMYIHRDLRVGEKAQAENYAPLLEDNRKNRSSL